MASGSPDYYTPDAQLADAITELEAATAALLDVVSKLGDVTDSLGTNLNTLTNDIKTLLTTLRSQAMGEATSLHASGSGTLNEGASTQILAAWSGRTGFSVRLTGGVAGYLTIGGSTHYGMATLSASGYYQNETYCGAIRIKSSGDGLPYAYEEW